MSVWAALAGVSEGMAEGRAQDIKEQQQARQSRLQNMRAAKEFVGLFPEHEGQYYNIARELDLPGGEETAKAIWSWGQRQKKLQEDERAFQSYKRHAEIKSVFDGAFGRAVATAEDPAKVQEMTLSGLPEGMRPFAQSQFQSVDLGKVIGQRRQKEAVSFATQIKNLGIREPEQIDNFIKSNGLTPSVGALIKGITNRAQENLQKKQLADLKNKVAGDGDVKFALSQNDTSLMPAIRARINMLAGGFGVTLDDSAVNQIIKDVEAVAPLAENRVNAVREASFTDLVMAGRKDLVDAYKTNSSEQVDQLLRGFASQAGYKNLTDEKLAELAAKANGLVREEGESQARLEYEGFADTLRKRFSDQFDAHEKARAELMNKKAKTLTETILGKDTFNTPEGRDVAEAIAIAAQMTSADYSKIEAAFLAMGAENIRKHFDADGVGSMSRLMLAQLAKAGIALDAPASRRSAFIEKQMQAIPNYAEGDEVEAEFQADNNALDALDINKIMQGATSEKQLTINKNKALEGLKDERRKWQVRLAAPQLSGPGGPDPERLQSLIAHYTKLIQEVSGLFLTPDTGEYEGMQNIGGDGRHNPYLRDLIPSESMILPKNLMEATDAMREYYIGGGSEKSD